MKTDKVLYALKESIGYYERYRRTEETMELRRLLREAIAERIGELEAAAKPLADLADRQMPPVLKVYKRKPEPKPPKHFDEAV